MNGDACKFSHEPLTDESRQLLDKVEAFVCCSVYITHVDCALSVNITLQHYYTACGVTNTCQMFWCIL